MIRIMDGLEPERSKTKPQSERAFLSKARAARSLRDGEVQAPALRSASFSKERQFLSSSPLFVGRLDQVKEAPSLSGEPGGRASLNPSQAAVQRAPAGAAVRKVCPGPPLCFGPEASTRSSRFLKVPLPRVASRCARPSLSRFPHRPSRGDHWPWWRHPAADQSREWCNHRSQPGDQRTGIQHSAFCWK